MSHWEHAGSILGTDYQLVTDGEGAWGIARAGEESVMVRWMGVPVRDPAPGAPDDVFELMGSLTQQAFADHATVANRIQCALIQAPEAAIEIGVELGCISIRETAIAICQAAHIEED